jgi:hypothetical protein
MCDNIRTIFYLKRKMLFVVDGEEERDHRKVTGLTSVPGQQLTISQEEKQD